MIWRRNLKKLSNTYVTGANLTVDGGLVLTGMGDMNIGKDEVSCGFVIKKNISKEEMETW